MSASFPYKKVLVIGATSGIGRAFAHKLVDNGISVVAVGRRQEQLDEFVNAGGAKAHASQFDITNISGITDWAASIHKQHSDLDFVWINSGVQRTFNFAKPGTVDMSVFESELTTNYMASIHLAMAFLPYLQQRSSTSPTAIAFTTSGLALVPMLRCGGYCATKAAMHSFILVLREQLKTESPNVKCIEFLPPAVQTELHDAKHQPDIKDGHKIGMPLKEYVDKTWAKMLDGQDQIPIGLAEPHFEEGRFEYQRQEAFHNFVEKTRT